MHVAAVPVGPSGQELAHEIEKRSITTQQRRSMMDYEVFHLDLIPGFRPVKSQLLPEPIK